MKGKGPLILGVLGALGLGWLLTRKAEAAPPPPPGGGEMVLMRNRLTGQTAWIYRNDVPAYLYPAGDWDLV